MAENIGRFGNGNTRENLEWQDAALCAQTYPDAFLPEKGGSSVDAKRVCAQCTVGRKCLDYALSSPDRGGILAGFSDRERRVLKGLSSEALDDAFKANREKILARAA